MEVYDFNIPGVTVLPNKTDSPLDVDSDTTFTLSISVELLKIVGWWGSEVLTFTCTVDHLEFPAGLTLDFVRQIGRPFSVVYLLSLVTTK